MVVNGDGSGRGYDQYPPHSMEWISNLYPSHVMRMRGCNLRPRDRGNKRYNRWPDGRGNERCNIRPRGRGNRGYHVWPHGRGIAASEGDATYLDDDYASEQDATYLDDYGASQGDAIFMKEVMMYLV